MKKLIFTAMLLLVLGTTWMLYLEYENRRFIDGLGKNPSTLRQSNTIEMPAVSKKGETVEENSVSSALDPENTSASSEHTYPQEETAVPFKATPSEPITDEILEPSFEESRREETDISTEELEKHFDAMATLEKIVYDSNNWVKGKPGEAGFSFVLSREDSEEFFRANAFLNPTQANKQALEQARPPQSVLNQVLHQETQNVVEYNGIKINLPAGFSSDD